MRIALVTLGTICGKKIYDVLTIENFLDSPLINAISITKVELQTAIVLWNLSNYIKSSISVIIALLCTVTIFIFAKKLNAGSNKFTAGLSQQETAAPTEEVGEGLNWYNETCAADPEGDACSSCQLCASKEACDKCVEKPVACRRCDCDPERSGMLCKYLKSEININDAGNATENNSTRENSELSFVEKLGASLGEPAEDSPCRNITPMIDLGFGQKLSDVQKRMCQLYESTNSWHCNYEGGAIPEKLGCVATVMAESAATKNLTAGMLIGCLIGHLVNICVAIWCTEGASSKKDYEYKLQDDVNMGVDKGKQAEN